jgi:DNA mismatch repair ATPase MutL
VSQFQDHFSTLAARYADLSAAGFEIEPMSGRSWAIAALPAEATDREPAETLRTALAALADLGSADEVLRRDKVAASVACRSAVTIRYHLAPEEIRRLIGDWAKTARARARTAGGSVDDRGRAREIFQAAIGWSRAAARAVPTNL